MPPGRTALDRQGSREGIGRGKGEQYTCRRRGPSFGNLVGARLLVQLTMIPKRDFR